MSKNKSEQSKKNETAAPASAAAAETPKDGAQVVIGRKITLKPLQKMPFSAIAKIAGTVVKSEIKQTSYGDSTCFIGEFGMLISESGKFNGDEVMHRAGIAYLPKAAESVLYSALASQMNKTDFGGVEFSFQIKKVESEASKTGYEWEVTAKRQPSEKQDRLLQLMG